MLHAYLIQLLSRSCTALILCCYLMLLSYAIILCCYNMLLSYAVTFCCYLVLLSFAVILCYYLLLLSYLICIRYELMRGCWEETARQRPSFTLLRKQLENVLWEMERNHGSILNIHQMSDNMFDILCDQPGEKC